jgi:hypothetical protein
MGIKDWFGGGGDKKKDEFRDKVKEAVSHGKLSKEKEEELEALRKNLDVTEASDDKTRLRRDVYNEAVDAVKAGGKLTPTEAAELARIQKFLALNDDQVEKTKWDLVRLKTVTEIREGRLPLVSPNNNTLRGIKLEAGEVPHYCVPAELFDVSDPGPAVGARFMYGMQYVPGAGKAFASPTKDATPFGEGFFLFTSERLIFKGAQRTYSFKFNEPDNVYFYRDGMRLKTKKANWLVYFRSDGISDVVGALLSRFQEQ